MPHGVDRGRAVCEKHPTNWLATGISRDTSKKDTSSCRCPCGFQNRKNRDRCLKCGWEKIQVVPGDECDTCGRAVGDKMICATCGVNPSLIVEEDRPPTTPGVGLALCELIECTTSGPLWDDGTVKLTKNEVGGV